VSRVAATVDVQRGSGERRTARSPGRQLAAPRIGIVAAGAEPGHADDGGRCLASYSSEGRGQGETSELAGPRVDERRVSGTDIC
jgi:hypothetical protein